MEDILKPNMGINGNVNIAAQNIADKNSNKICFQKEKHLLLNLVEIFTNYQIFKSDVLSAPKINIF